MNLIDFICIIYFANLFSAYVAIIVANMYMIKLANLILQFFGFTNTENVNILSFIFIFLFIYSCLKLIGKVLNPLNSIPLFASLNKMAGAIFGLLKGLLISTFIIIYLPLITEENKINELMKKGVFSSVIYSLAHPIYSTFTWILPSAEDALEKITNTNKAPQI
jgi:membrane protein required for colicin V production